MESVSVLLLEDHEGEARLNQRLLERSYTTEFRFATAGTLAEAVRLLDSGAFDVILLDLNLPDSKGLDTLLHIMRAAPGIPVVIVSASADDRLAQEAIRRGAQDYLVKGGITSEILTRVVRYAIARGIGHSQPGSASTDEIHDGLPLHAAFTIDADGRIASATSSLAMLLGAPSIADVHLQPLLAFFTSAEGPRIAEMLDRVRRGGGAEYLLARPDRPHATAPHLLITLDRVAHEGSTGILHGTVVAAPEGLSTRGDGAQLAIQYRTLVEHSQDGIFIVTDNIISYSSASLATMLGREVAEIEGQEAGILIAPEDLGRFLENSDRHARGEDADSSYEISVMHRDGSRLHAQLSVGRIVLGERVGVMGTVKNISEIHRVAYLMRLQHRIAIGLAAAQGRTEVYEQVLHGLLSIEHVDMAALYVREKQSDGFVRVLWRGMAGPFPAPDDDPAFRHAHDRLIREGASHFIGAAEISSDRLGAMLLSTGVRGFGLIPIMHAGRSIAAIDVATVTMDNFRDSVQRVLESIASLLGGVLARLDAEQARKESEILYRAVVEKSHDAMFIYRDDRILFVNEKSAAITGFSRDELLARDPWSLVHPEDRTQLRGMVAQRGSTTDPPIVYEGRVLTRDGTIRIGEFAATRIRYEGEPAALITVRDVTARKTQEEELRRSDALIRAAGLAAARFLRSARWQDCIMEVLERLGSAANVCRVVILESVNEGNASRLMRQRAVWIRPEMRDIMIDRVPDGQSFDDPPFSRWASELAAGRSIACVIDDLPNEEQIVLARQNVRSVAMMPVFDGETWWGMMRFDECRIRRTWLHSEIEAMAVSAETLGAAIRRASAEGELVTSREQALQADAIKNAFIANISHEVRTPVNIILGYLALVEEMTSDDNDPELHEFMNAINAASRRLIRTVDAILNISRFKSHDIVPQRIPIRIDKYLDTIGEKYAEAIAAKDLAYRFHNHCGAVEILGDDYFLRQAFEHLLDNAVKFTSTGSVTVSLNQDENAGVLVTIEDTGIGISEQFLEKIFDPYLQEDMGYNRRYEGVGLGLTLVKLYLEAQGATIAVHSVKGSGTRCDVRFPRAGS
ncbi:MAG: PAS domain S-box protein [Bacteroidota bacterium]|jgi:PAS domain S-box-containing protein|nr:PAS domain S-box protein [Bacteroidota bacterium]